MLPLRVAAPLGILHSRAAHTVLVDPSRKGPRMPSPVNRYRSSARYLASDPNLINHGPNFALVLRIHDDYEIRWGFQ